MNGRSPAARPVVLDAYAKILSARAIARIRAGVAAVHGARILHVSATASSTYHSRLLSAVVPLMKELGVEVDWLVPPATDEDRALATAVYRAIEGEEDSERDLSSLAPAWSDYARRSAAALTRGYDFIVVHDPQLLLMHRKLGRRETSATRWIWHCHHDLRDCDVRVERILTDHASGFDHVAIEHPDFAGRVTTPSQTIVPPAIDPLSERNKTLHPDVADGLFRRLGLRRDRPLVVQVSLFDGWDDPQWPLCTYEAAHRLVPELQLALVSTTRAGDENLSPHREKLQSKPVSILRSTEVNDAEINALQGAAAAAMQHGVRKGFSSALLEASWKGRPVIACEGGALTDQVLDGKTGFVFNDFDQGGQRLAELVGDSALADALGFEGHRVVRDNHLVIRWVEEYLNLFAPAAVTVA